MELLHKKRKYEEPFIELLRCDITHLLEDTEILIPAAKKQDSHSSDWTDEEESPDAPQRVGYGEFNNYESEPWSEK